MSTSEAALAQDLPRFGPLISFQMYVKNPDGELVLDIRGSPKDPTDTEPPFVSKATMRVSPKLCEATYRVGFVFTTNKGDRREIPYPARLRRARLDRVATRCPFEGLPRRGLKSMHARLTIDGNPLMDFAAYPSTRSGNPFAWLQAPALNFHRVTTPAGLLRVRVRARYSSAKSHTVAFVARTGIRLPRSSPTT